MDKYYFECGNVRDIFVADNEQEGAYIFMKRAIRDLQDSEDGDDPITFGEFVLVSNYGFNKDVAEMGVEAEKQASEFKAFVTTMILESIGETFMAEDMKKWLEDN